MKRVFTLALLLGFLLCACGQSVPTWQEQYDLGVRYLSEGNYEEAILAFTAAIEIDPKQAPAYVGRGDAYFTAAQTLMEGMDSAEFPAEVTTGYENAIADYLETLDLDESAAEIYRKIADIYVMLGDEDSAVAILERGVSSTESLELQDYLNELTIIPPEYVLIQQDIYSAMSSGENHSTFSYDEAGFLISADSWKTYEDDPEKHWHSVTYSYDKENKTWLKEVTDNGESKTEIVKKRLPGPSDYTEATGWGYNKGFAYMKPFNSNVEGSGIKGYTTQYTYDDQGNVIRTDTYNESGILTGYCILTWEKFIH